jgi:hypothetical protein
MAASEAAAAATPVAPAEGSVIAIHSLDEWSIQIEEANSAKKLVLFLWLCIWPPFACRCKEWNLARSVHAYGLRSSWDMLD